MANIKVRVEYPIKDGVTFTFHAPCNCSDVDGITVQHPDGETRFAFKDTHGNDLTGLNNLFTTGSLVTVVLDVTNNAAFLQNADTNGYLENQISVERARIDELVAMRRMGVDNIYAFVDDVYGVEVHIHTNGVAAILAINIENDLPIINGSPYVFDKIPWGFDPIMRPDLMQATSLGERVYVQLMDRFFDERGYTPLYISTMGGDGSNTVAKGSFSFEYQLATPFIAEVTDLRVDRHGTVYPTAREAVTAQIVEIDQRVGNLVNEVHQNVEDIEQLKNMASNVADNTDHIQDLQESIGDLHTRIDGHVTIVDTSDGAVEGIVVGGEAYDGFVDYTARADIEDLKKNGIDLDSDGWGTIKITKAKTPEEPDEPDTPIEPDEPEIITETESATSTADARKNHFLTLSSENLPHATDDKVLSVFDTEASQVMRYSGANWYAEKDFTVTAAKTVELPFVLPAGIYSVSATYTGSVAQPYFTFQDGEGNNIGQIANKDTVYHPALDYKEALNRSGALFKTISPIVQFKMNSVGEYANFCLRYYPEFPDTGNTAANNVLRYGYDEAVDYYDCEIFNVTNGVPFKEGTTLLAEGGVEFSVRHKYEYEYVVEPDEPDEPLEPEEPTEDEYTYVGEANVLIFDNEKYDSFRDRKARNDIEELTDQVKTLQNLVEQGGGTVPDTPSTPTDTLPYYLIAETDRVSAEVQKIGAGTDLCFLAFADPHTFDDDKYRKYAMLMNNPSVDFMLGLGDYNPYSDTNTKADCIAGLSEVLSVSGKDTNCFYVAGNHDIAVIGNNVNEASVISKQEQHDLLCNHLDGVAHFDEDDPNGCYYYVDYDYAKIRLIVLNSSEMRDDEGNIVATKNIRFTQRQMDWLAGVALDFTDKSGWSVMVAIHTIKIGTDNYTLHKLLSAVKDGKEINAIVGGYTVNADYTGKSAAVIGIFYGHDHRDTVDTYTYTVDTYTYSDIKSIQFRCDNADKNYLYCAKITAEVGAGNNYKFVVQQDKYPETNDKWWSFTMPSLAVTPKYIEYEAYSTKTTHVSIWLLDENYNQLWYGYRNSAENNSDAVEIAPKDRFKPRRMEGTRSMESCAVVNINKDAKTITIVPYGLGDARVINYG